MSVSSTTTKNSYSGDGSTVAFAYAFKIFADADLEVIIRASAGTETTKTLTTHYTVSGAGSDSGGTVTFTTGNTPASGETVVIRRKLTLTQGTDYVENDPFPANSHEDGLDRLTFIAQGIQEELDRSFKVSKTNSITTPEFTDDASTRASKLLGFSSDGNSLEATTGRVNTVSVSNVAVDGSGNSQSATASFNSTSGALALGVPVGSTGATGSTGAAGSDGTDGVGGLPYTFSTTTSDADPGAGVIRLNNGTLGSVSEIYIDDSTAASGNPDVSAFLLTWDDSTQTSDRGQVTITKKSAQQNFATYKISGASTDASGYVKLAVTHVVSNGSFSNSDAVLVSFVRTGNAGSLADPMTTRGDMIVRDSSNATARLAIGSANTVLKSDGTDISWGYTVGTSANNLVQLNGSAQLPAVSGANLTNLPVTDVSSDVRFLALQVASDRIGLEDGIADPFSDETDVDTSTSSNELFNSTGTYYSGLTSSAVSQGTGTAIGNMTSGGGLAASFDSTTAQAANVSAGISSNVSSGNVGKDWGSGNTKRIQKIDVYPSNNLGLATTSGGSPDIALTIKLQGSTDNFSASVVDLGSLAVGTSVTAKQTITATDITAFRYHRLLITPDSNAQVYCAELEFTEYATANLTLVSNAFTADTAPSSAVIGVQVVENESITVNTDLTAEVSRDGGTTFTSCTLVLNTTLGATGTKYYESASTDISSQPSGTAMKYRIKTLNTKDIEVHGVALKWS